MGRKPPGVALLWAGAQLQRHSQGPWEGERDAALPPGGSFMSSLLIPKKQLPVPPSREAAGLGSGETRNLLLHITSQQKSLSPLTTWSHAEIRTSRTLLRVFEVLPGAHLCQLPTSQLPFGVHPKPTQGPGAVGSQGAPGPVPSQLLIRGTPTPGDL